MDSLNDGYRTLWLKQLELKTFLFPSIILSEIKCIKVTRRDDPTPRSELVLLPPRQAVLLLPQHWSSADARSLGGEVLDKLETSPAQSQPQRSQQQPSPEDCVFSHSWKGRAKTFTTQTDLPVPGRRQAPK